MGEFSTSLELYQLKKIESLPIRKILNLQLSIQETEHLYKQPYLQHFVHGPLA